MNFAFELSQQDVEKYQAEFLATVNQASGEILTSMGHVAVEHLKELDTELGHTRLAEMWDQTEPTEDGDSLFVDVFSHAVEQTFFSPGWDSSGNRIQSDPRYPISGQMLLAILEGGASPHFIFPKNANKLILPTPTLAQRTSEFQKQYGFSYTSYPEPTADRAYAEDVMHPGVVGNANIESTAELIEIGLAEYAEEVADQVAVLMNGQP